MIIDKTRAATRSVPQLYNVLSWAQPSFVAPGVEYGH